MSETLSAAAAIFASQDTDKIHQERKQRSIQRWKGRRSVGYAYCSRGWQGQGSCLLLLCSLTCPTEVEIARRFLLTSYKVEPSPRRTPRLNFTWRPRETLEKGKPSFFLSPSGFFRFEPPRQFVSMYIFQGSVSLLCRWLISSAGAFGDLQSFSAWEYSGGAEIQTGKQFCDIFYFGHSDGESFANDIWKCLTTS